MMFNGTSVSGSRPPLSDRVSTHPKHTGFSDENRLGWKCVTEKFIDKIGKKSSNKAC